MIRLMLCSLFLTGCATIIPTPNVEFVDYASILNKVRTTSLNDNPGGIYRGQKVWFDNKYQTGDIVRIDVMENIISNQQSSLKNDKSSTAGLMYQGLSYLKSDVNNHTDGKGENKSSSSVIFTTSGIVINEINDILELESVKNIGLNDNRQTLYIHGYVNKNVINNRSLRSTDMANLDIRIYDKGTFEGTTKGGWLTTIFNIVNPL